MRPSYKDVHGNRRPPSQYTSFHTCDKPMCVECAHRVGEEVDYCDEHYNEFCVAKTEFSNRIYAKMIDDLEEAHDAD